MGVFDVEEVEGAFGLVEGDVVAPVPEDGRVAHVDVDEAV